LNILLKKEFDRRKIEFLQVHTSWPLPALMSFLPNLFKELALNMSCSVVLLIGIVPSGHDSPDKLHN